MLAATATPLSSMARSMEAAATGIPPAWYAAPSTSTLAGMAGPSRASAMRSASRRTPAPARVAPSMVDSI